MVDTAALRRLAEALAEQKQEGVFALGLKSSAALNAAADEIDRLREALGETREELMWSAYATGAERDGQWSHLFMSDGEWLARELGLDPKQGLYDAAEVKAAIPVRARALLPGDEKGAK